MSQSHSAQQLCHIAIIPYHIAVMVVGVPAVDPVLQDMNTKQDIPL